MTHAGTAWPRGLKQEEKSSVYGHYLKIQSDPTDTVPLYPLLSDPPEVHSHTDAGWETRDRGTALASTAAKL